MNIINSLGASIVATVITAILILQVTRSIEIDDDQAKRFAIIVLLSATGTFLFLIS